MKKLAPDTCETAMKNKKITTDGTDTVRRLDGQTVGQFCISIREISAISG